MKIFQIGFNRCGTRTIHEYLSNNGIRSVHFDNGRLARRIFTNLSKGDDLLAGYEDFDAFTDMEFLGDGIFLEAYKLFPYFAEQYRDAVFILNTRDRESWIRSRLRHGSKSSYARRQMSYFNARSIQQVKDIWRTEWELHHKRVIEFFADRPYRFSVCRIETDLPDLLNRMLPECKLDPKFYRPLNKVSMLTRCRQLLSSA